MRQDSVRDGGWSAVVAAVITVAGGLALVWYQTGKASTHTDELLREFSDTVKSSVDLQRAIRRPLEGRWTYEMSWDRYFTVESSSDDPAVQFFGRGLAFILWGNEQYHVLLGYENRSRAGDILAVSVNSGFVASPPDGFVEIGARLVMNYNHRWGKSEYDANGQVLRAVDLPERAYHYTITGYDVDSAGKVSAIRAEYEIDESKGSLSLVRID